MHRHDPSRYTTIPPRQRSAKQCGWVALCVYSTYLVCVVARRCYVLWADATKGGEGCVAINQLLRGVT